MKKHIVASDFDYKSAVGEWNDLPSETIPDQTLTISEIMKRYANGLPLDGERVPWYEGTEDEITENGDFPDITKMDKVDRLMLATYAKMDADEKRKQLKDLKKKVEEKEKQIREQKLQRTSGEGADQGAKGAPDKINPNPKKLPAAGVKNTQTPPNQNANE